MNQKIRVALLSGGPSLEYDVSLASAKVVSDELDVDKYEVFPVVISKDGEWPIELDDLKEGIDIAFIAMHGEYGEDGTVQEILREAGIPYTGSDVLPSALAMNKILSSRIFNVYGINVPKFVDLDIQGRKDFSFDDLDYPVVVKPADRGSSLGISVVCKEEDLEDALINAFGFSSNVIIQELIQGREITCAVIDDGVGDAIPLPPTEIIPKLGGLFDYHAKYFAGVTDTITPARLTDKGTR